MEASRVLNKQIWVCLQRNPSYYTITAYVRTTVHTQTSLCILFQSRGYPPNIENSTFKYKNSLPYHNAGWCEWLRLIQIVWVQNSQTATMGKLIVIETTNQEKFAIRANIKRARCEYQLQLMASVGEVTCKFHGLRPQLICFQSMILFIPPQHIFCLTPFYIQLI